MYQYLTQLVIHSPHLSLKGEIVDAIMDLYVDIVNLFVCENDQNRTYSYYNAPA